MKNFAASALAVLALASSGPVLAHGGAEHASEAAPAATPAVAATRAALRDLWIGHVFWVRNVVDARFAGNAARASAAEKEVVANARAIAGAIKPFYGKPASERLFALLAGHWQAISAYLDGARAGDEEATKGAMGRLLANADEIAKFLSGANPNLPYDTVRGLLAAHGSHHAQQISQFKAGQWDAEARTWEAMKDHMYVIADALADAIAKQFPDRFR
jgi:hypothetical protein